MSVNKIPVNKTNLEASKNLTPDKVSQKAQANKENLMERIKNLDLTAINKGCSDKNTSQLYTDWTKVYTDWTQAGSFNTYPVGQ